MNMNGTSEAKTIEEAKLLVKSAFEQIGLEIPAWRVCEGSITPWEYTDINAGGFKDFSVGVSSGGVVSVDGKPFTPVEGKLNVTLERVLVSLKSKIESLGIDVSTLTTHKLAP